MARYSGIYLHYEGITAQCDVVQQNRESVFDTSSGMMRYQDSAGNRYYLGGGDSYWELDADNKSIYFPSLPEEEKLVRIGPTGNSSGVIIGFRELFGGTPSGLYLISAPSGTDKLDGRTIWLRGSNGMTIETTSGTINITSVSNGTFSTGGGLTLDSTNAIDLLAGTKINLSGDTHIYGDATIHQLITDDMPQLIFSGPNYTGIIEWRGQAGYMGGYDYFWVNSSMHIEKSATEDYALETGTDGNIYSRGYIEVEGDVFTSAWGQFFSPTVSGWFPGYDAEIMYKVVGNLVFVKYSINGSGNGDYTGFDLPVAASGSYATVPVAGFNINAVHSSANTSGIAGFIKNSWAYFSIDGYDSDSDGYSTIWGSGEAEDMKWLCGQFWYEKA